MKPVKVIREYEEYISSDNIQFQSYYDCVKHELNKLYSVNDYYYVYELATNKLYICTFDGGSRFNVVGKSTFDNNCKIFNIVSDKSFEVYSIKMGEKIPCNIDIER
jgi:hypothetical protein